MNNKLIILTEAGEGIGYGHYTRCSALSGYFIENGIDVKFLIYARGEVNVNNADVIDWHNQKEILINFSTLYPIVLVDSYLIDNNYYDFLSSYFKRVVVIDDYNRLSYNASLIINPNIYGDELDYRNQKIKIVGGRNYVILRKVFRETVQRYRAPENIKKILITLGGSDIRQLLPKLIEWIGSGHYELFIVTGSDQYRDSLKRYKARCKAILGFVNAAKMEELMLSSDFVISACGQTLHELAYLGIPAIGICVGNDQINNMKKYVQLNYLPAELYWDDQNLKIELMKWIRSLNNKEELTKVSQNGSLVIDGSGVKNIYNQIFQF